VVSPTPDPSPPINATARADATVIPTASRPIVTPATPTTEPGTTQVVKHGVPELASASLAGVRLVGGTLTLDQNTGGYPQSGTITSGEIATPFAFDTLVPSWNATAPTGTSLRCEIRVRANGTRSGWYVLGNWSASQRGSVSNQRDSIGSVDVDTLKLNLPAQAFQYRFTLISADPKQTPSLRLVAVNYASLRDGLRGPAVSPAPGWFRDLPVPVQSQLLQTANLAWDVCSPTSLAMVLQYWKIPASVPEVISGVRDQTNGIYGNWPFNTAFAGRQGLEAYVNRFTSMVELQNEIAASRPVVTSIRFAAGELANAPITSTSGHLLVVRGFTANGDVIVNDPVAPNLAEVRRVYQRAQFANVWLRHGGVAYQIRQA